MAGASLRDNLLKERTDGVVPHVGVGTWVKVELRSEKFWCLVRSVRADGALVASVEDNLIYSLHRVGDQIILQPRHVLETANVRDYVVFQSLVSVLGNNEGALVWRDLWRE